MTWWAMSVQAPEALRPDVASWLVRRTGQTVEERADGSLVGFAADRSTATALRDDLARAFGEGLRTDLTEVEPVDWGTRWRDGLEARRIGRLTLAPSWTGPVEGDAVVLIDPETAFGSGEHGSTRVALALLESLITPGDLVLDLGSGSGVLAIAARKLGARAAIGIEMDPEAIEVAERNAARNGVTDAVGFVEGEGGSLALVAGPADVVVANILREINVAILPEVRRALRPGGTAIFAGMEEAEAPLFRPVLAATGFTIVREMVDAGWWGVAGRP